MTPAIVAIGGGFLLALVGLVPWAAVQYRRRGTLGIGNALIAFATVVYALALVTFTLLPLPGNTAQLCTGGSAAPQLDPFTFVRDIADNGGISGPASLLTNPAAAQVILNVSLFIPLGMIVRYRLLRGRLVSGLIASTLVGVVVSLLIEFTQLTGDWFLYPCAYRLFDVDDIIANTLGAVLGALVAPILRIVPGQVSAEPDRPRPVTAARRFLGMGLDVTAVLVLQTLFPIVVALSVLVGGGDPESAGATAVITALAYLPALGQLVLVVTCGRTLGEIVVRLRPSRRPGIGRSLARWAFGIGGWSVLSVVSLPFASLLAFVLAAASIFGVWATRGHRGTAYALLDLDVYDERTSAPVT